MECAARAGRKEKQSASQPAREGRGGQLVPSRLEPDHKSSCRNRWILPPHFQVPVPSWERPLVVRTCPAKGEMKKREGKKRKGKQSILLSMYFTNWITQHQVASIVSYWDRSTLPCQCMVTIYLCNMISKTVSKYLFDR